MRKAVGEIVVKDGEECPNHSCRWHVRHPCELCGRKGAHGEARVKWGCLVVRQEEPAEYNVVEVQ